MTSGEGTSLSYIEPGALVQTFSPLCADATTARSRSGEAMNVRPGHEKSAAQAFIIGGL
jgi:hypothetical protein